MRALARLKLPPMLTGIVMTIAVIFLPAAINASPTIAAQASTAKGKHYTLNCAAPGAECTEVNNSYWVFGDHYVGHDEPSNLFYSNVAGSGNNTRWELNLPKDPAGNKPVPGKSWNFQLHPAFWFGMAMCDTQSYPEILSTCKADSDSNIVDPSISPNHPGMAFTELQFYPPGGVMWPGGDSCDPTKWCAALNIDNLLENPVTGQQQNQTCQGMVGIETVNFAFITTSGVPQPNSPPNPVQSTLNTFTPNPAYDLFMNSGDDLTVTLHDTGHGLETDIMDNTTGVKGFMTASAANGFGHVQWDPSGTSCNNIPYNFHPMYSTASEQTRVTWAAHTYNVAFADEIGHFDYCNGSNTITPGGACPTGNTEGMLGDQEPTDADDLACFPASSFSRVQVSGCYGTNDGTGVGFDGVPYQNLWPDGNTTLHPTPIRFSSPLTGSQYKTNYSRSAFESNTPRLEVTFGSCNRDNGQGCTIIPLTDDGFPAVFYPFFSMGQFQKDCSWMIGNHMPGSKNDFGQDNQYGQLESVTYTNFGGGGGSITYFEDYRQILSHNPCPSND